MWRYKMTNFCDTAKEQKKQHGTLFFGKTYNVSARGSSYIPSNRAWKWPWTVSGESEVKFCGASRRFGILFGMFRSYLIYVPDQQTSITYTQPRYIIAAVIYSTSFAVAVDSSYMTASSSASWSRFSPPSNFVNGHESTMLFMVCCWPQSQEGDWARPHLHKLAWHGPWPVLERFIRDPQYN